MNAVTAGSAVALVSIASGRFPTPPDALSRHKKTDPKGTGGALRTPRETRSGRPSLDSEGVPYHETHTGRNKDHG